MIAVSLLELLPTAKEVGLTFENILMWLVVGLSIFLFLHFLSNKLEIVGNRLEKSAYLVAAALILHNFPEGSVAISTTIVDVNSGLIAALALSLHNIPEGLAIAVTAVAAGMAARKVFALVAAATFAEILGAFVVLYESEELSEVAVARLLTVVAGIMITVAVRELIPHGLASRKRSRNKAR
jgi:ZIP family zinc transporter